MKPQLQIGCFLIALGIGAGMALPCAAQNHQANKPPQQQRQEQRPQSRPAPRPERRQDTRRAPNGRPNADRPSNVAPPNRIPPNRQTESMGMVNGGNRPPNARGESAQPNFNPNRPPNASNRPANTKRYQDLSPQEKKNYEDFRRLPPQKQQEIRETLRTWQRLTPEQQGHIRNDVLPKWQQMPPARQRAIRQRLGVLQNMPESARNQHLNDPNFTRGMSEEDKAMLRDLSHMHVGAPDPPNE
jgi:hypothetical protein